MIKNNPSRTKRKLQVATIAMICLVFAPMIAATNGADEYVVGTVSKISESAVTVKTAAGKFVKVSFGEKTIYLRSKRPIKRSSIHGGDRIVIYAVKVKKKLIANTVEVRARVSGGYV